jgi:ATP/maltotriose-dependent transcriptional regulator MalT
MKTRRATAKSNELTHRERQIVRLVSEGLSNKEIGRRLKVTDATIKVHFHNIFEKLRVSRGLSPGSGSGTTGS